MANILPRQVEYIATEADMRQQVGKILSDRFIKDYVAIKQNIGASIDQTNANSQTIETLDGRLDVLEPEVEDLGLRLWLAEGEIVDTRTDLDNHVAAGSAHGANGNIVGTGDYCAATVGGVVLLANPVADASQASITVPIFVAAAGATYSQAHTQTQIDTINALRQNMTDLIASHNALVTVVNQMLATERTAKQRAL